MVPAGNSVGPNSVHSFPSNTTSSSATVSGKVSAVGVGASVGGMGVGAATGTPHPTNRDTVKIAYTTPRDRFSSFIVLAPCISMFASHHRAGVECLVEAEVDVWLLEAWPRPKDCRLGSTRGLESAGCSLAAHHPQGWESRRCPRSPQINLASGRWCDVLLWDRCGQAQSCCCNPR